MSDLGAYGPALLPGSEVLNGKHVALEPIVDEGRFDELFEAFSASDEDATFRYLGYGPFEDKSAFAEFGRRTYLTKDLHFYSLVPRPGPDAAVSDGEGEAKGVMALMRADPTNGAIEIGHICLGPSLQRTAAPTEAVYLLMKLCFETLGYRRFEWKCDAGNARSRRAAERFGFTFEGIFRQHMIVKGRNRDTAWFSILDGEWPTVRQGFEEWLAPENFDADGRQRSTLADLRSRGAPQA